jgi:hypothetical protein
MYTGYCKTTRVPNLRIYATNAGCRSFVRVELRARRMSRRDGLDSSSR